MLRIAIIEPLIDSYSGAAELVTAAWRCVDLILCWGNFYDSKHAAHCYSIKDKASEGRVAIFELGEELSQHLSWIQLDIMVVFHDTKLYDAASYQ